MRSRVLAAFLALALGLPGPLAAQAAAQDKPDFSGHWVLANPRKPNERARELTVWHTRNEPDAPSGVLHVERRFGNSRNIESESLLIGIRSATVNGISPGSTQAFPSTSSLVSVTWNGSRLVVEKSSYSGPGTATQHVEEWSLTRKNTLLITMTDRIRGSLQPKTVRVIYRRRSVR